MAKTGGDRRGGASVVGGVLVWAVSKVVEEDGEAAAGVVGPVDASPGAQGDCPVKRAPFAGGRWQARARASAAPIW